MRFRNNALKSKSHPHIHTHKQKHLKITINPCRNHFTERSQNFKLRTARRQRRKKKYFIKNRKTYWLSESGQ